MKLKLLTTIALLLMAVSGAWADDSGSCGTSVSYSYVESTHTLTISGTGDMADYGNQDGQPWKDYRSSITRVDINSGVTSIGSNAFAQCTNMSYVNIDMDVTSIGNNAFSGSGLTSINIPSSVTSLGEGAFEGCELLSCAIIGDDVASIGDDAFSNCPKLETILVSQYNSIYDSRNSCDAIIDTDLNKLVVGCKGTTIPNTVTSIGNNAFKGCTGLTSITIPASVTSIGSNAFESCTSLASINIPASVTSIGMNAFKSCTSLASVTVFASTPPTLGTNAFSGCNSGLQIYVYSDLEGAYQTNWSAYSGIITAINQSGTCGAAGNENDVTWQLALTSTSGVLTISGTGAMVDYGGSDGQLWKDYRSFITSVVIEDGVTSIGNYAFSKCANLTSVIIPNGVTSLGDNAFNECTGLTSIDIPASVTSIGVSAFYQCTGLTSIDIPASVTSIGDYAFCDCTGLTSIDIPASVTSIGYGAFWESGLTSINIPASVTSIGEAAFYHCTDLTSVDIPASVTSIGNSAFSGCTGLTSIDIPASVTSISNYAFYKSGLTSITIPASVTSIGEGAFQNCTGLTSVTVYASSAPTLGDYAFNDCTNLADIYVFSGFVDDYQNAAKWIAYKDIIKGINGGYCGTTDHETDVVWVLSGTSPNYTLTISGTGAMADYGENNQPWKDYLSSITSVVIEDGVTSIGSNAFRKSSLTSVTIPASVTSIGSDAFMFCSNLTSVTFADGSQLESIGGDYAFAYTGLTSFTIPASVTSIGNRAFEGSNLTSIVIPAKVSNIGSSVFGDCHNLATVTLLPSTPPDLASGASNRMGDNVSGDNKKFYFHGTAYGTDAHSEWNDMYNGNFSGYTSTVIYGATLSSDATTSPEAICSEGTTKYYTEGTSITLGHDEDPPTGYTFGYTVTKDGTDPAEAVEVTEDEGVYTFEMPDGDVTATANLEIISFEIEGVIYEWTSETTVKVAGYNGTSSTLIIPERVESYYVTEIGEGAFMGNTSLESIDMPNIITVIGRHAFMNCSNLSKIITIPASLMIIEEEAFEGCAINTLEIPDNVETIGERAFFNCTNLTSVTIPASVMYVAENAFEGCNGNLILYVPEGRVDGYRDSWPNVLAVSTNSIPYIDADGSEAYCDEYIVLNGNNDYTEINRPGWYVVKNSNTDPNDNDGVDISYPQGLIINGGEGNVNLILCDGAEMSIENENKNFALQVNGNSFNIYGQNDGTGKLTTSTDNDHGIYAVSCDMTINGGKVYATGKRAGIFAGSDITITGGSVEATGTNDTNGTGIESTEGSIIVSGGIVSATGTNGSQAAGIAADDGYITISWTNASDRITVSKYFTGASRGTCIKNGKAFTDGQGNIYIGTLTEDERNAIAGKTLTPAVVLADNADNTSAIASAATACTGGKTLAVQLQGRTLYRNGEWNTLCLPFSMDAEQIAASDLAGATIKEMASTSNLDNNGTLTLNFTPVYDGTAFASGFTQIDAGKPYIVKWETAAADITDPTFPDVTISSTTPVAVEFDIANSTDKCQFVGQYSPFSIVANDAVLSENQGHLNEIIMLGSGNTLGYSKSTRELKCFRAHFYVPANGGAAARAFVMNFGDGETTGIVSMEDGGWKMEDVNNAWYSIDGRKLNGVPTQKGVYINNGRKVVIK